MQHGQESSDSALSPSEGRERLPTQLFVARKRSSPCGPSSSRASDLGVTRIGNKARLASALNYNGRQRVMGYLQSFESSSGKPYPEQSIGGDFC